MIIFQYIKHVHFYKNNVKYVDANLDAPDNAISDNESSSEMLARQSQILLIILEYVSWLPLLGGQSVPKGSRNQVVCV